MKTISNNDLLIEAFFKLSRLMKENMSYSSSIAKLSLLQIQALVFLQQKPNAQMREIAVQFKIEMPTATSLVNKLCKMGLVVRKEDLQDRRLVRISLTDQGRSLLTKAKIDRSKKLTQIISYLSESDQQVLKKIIMTLIDKMEAQNNNEH